MKELAFFVMVLTSVATAAAETRVDPNQLRALQLGHPIALAIVDVRAPSDFAKAHIQGARNMPVGTVDGEGLDRGAKIVVYCGEDPCPLTSGAAQELRSDGYTDVSILAGGLPAWVAKGYPVESGDGVKVERSPHEVLRAKEARDGFRSGAAVPLDTRTATEFAAGHLPGAVNVALEDLDTALVRLDKSKEYVVYDRQEGRCRQAVEKLEAAGLKATELSGGLAGWVRKGLKLEVK